MRSHKLVIRDVANLVHQYDSHVEPTSSCFQRIKEGEALRLRVRRGADAREFEVDPAHARVVCCGDDDFVQRPILDVLPLSVHLVWFVGVFQGCDESIRLTARHNSGIAMVRPVMKSGHEYSR